MKGDAICGHCYFLADRHIIMAIGVSLPNGDKRRKWGFGWGHGLLVFPTWVTTTVLAAFVSFLRLKGTVMPRYFRLKPFEDLGSNELSLSLSRQVLCCLTWCYPQTICCAILRAKQVVWFGYVLDIVVQILKLARKFIDIRSIFLTVHNNAGVLKNFRL